MRILAFVFLTLIPCLAFSQRVERVERLEVKPNGLNGVIEKNFKDKSASILYKSIKKWADENVYNVYLGKNGDIENEYLSFKIIRTGEVTYHANEDWRWNLDLNVKLKIEDNKITTDIEILGIPGVNGTEDASLSGGHISLFTKKGEYRDSYNSIRESINLELNKFCKSIFKTIEKHSAQIQQG